METSGSRIKVPTTCLFDFPKLIQGGKGKYIDKTALLYELCNDADAQLFISPDSESKVCNPVSLGNALESGRLANYWESSGQASMIVDRIKAADEIPADLRSAHRVDVIKKSCRRKEARHVQGDGGGNMKHVQRNTVVNKSLWMFGGAGLAAACLCASTAFASATIDPDTNILTFDVASGEEAYAQEIPSTVAGIVKTGAGKIVLSVASTGFTGKSVQIDGGALEIQHKNALGSGNTITVAKDAQYCMKFYYSQHDTGGQNNDIVVKGGTGPDGNGAIYMPNPSNGARSDEFLGNVTLEGDALFKCGILRGFGKTVVLNGKALSLHGQFMFNDYSTVEGPGTIILQSSTTIFQGSPTFKGEGTVEAAGGNIQLWNLAKPMPYALRVADADVTIQLGRGLVNNSSANPAANIWAGSVEIDSGRKLTLTNYNADYAGDYLTIAGNISGDGELVIVSNYPEYRLTGTNTYSGGTTIGANHLRIFADGNLSTNGVIKLYDGFLELNLDGGSLSSDGVEGIVAQMSQTLYSGRGRLNLVTSTGTEATLSSDFSPLHQSIAICHEGAGSLTLSGDVHPDVMIRNFGGHLELTSEQNRVLWSFACATGTVDLAAGTIGKPHYDHAREYTVGSSNDEANARLRVLEGGRIDFPRLEGGTYSEALVVADAGTKPAIFEIHDGAVVTGKIEVALAENTKGAVYQYGGDVFQTTRNGNDGTLGRFGQAYWWVGGGKLSANSPDLFYALATRKDAEAQLEIQSGKLEFTGANSLLLGRHSSRAEMYMGGGEASLSYIHVGGDLNWSADKGATAGGMGVLTLSGTNNPSLTVGTTLNLCVRTNEYTGVVNLNAGVLAVNAIRSTSQDATSRGCKSYLNFNGGTLKYQNTKNPFNASLLPTRITVYGGGATIEFTQNSSLSSLGSVRLLRPTGRGIKSITVPASADVTGYAMPPVVKISGGGGEDATAYVRFDPRTGTIGRDIEVTSPGINFETAPMVTISAPDMKTPVVCDVELTGSEQEDGGIMLKGTSESIVNASDFAFMTNLTGAIVIGPGITLYPRITGVPNPFSANKELRMAGGEYSAWNSNPSWRRVGGYGKTRAWDPNRFSVTEALFFRAEDLEQGLCLTHDCGYITLGDGVVVEIDDFSKLTQRKYTLLKFEYNGKQSGAENYLHGSAPRLAEGAPVGWKLRLSANKKKLTLVHDEGTIMLFR